MNDHSVRGRETGDGCEMEGVWRRERDWGKEERAGEGVC